MKCIIYSRVSTTDQTTENQILQLREYAAKQGWEVFAVGRPKLNPAIDQQAIKLRKQGYSYSRIARELSISKTHAYKLCR